MTNALQLNQSTPIAGLGTSSYTLTTAGLYTLQFKSFLPYLAAGSPAVTTQPSPASVNVGLGADSSGSLNNTFFLFGSAGDNTLFYVWYNINSAGTDPAVAGRTGIAVTGATGATAATLATATFNAINANATAAKYVVATNPTSGHCAIANIQYGLNTAAADGSAPTGFTLTNTAGSYGVPVTSGLNVYLKQGSTILATYGFPTPTQPIMGGSVMIQASANDVATVLLTSLSTADNALNSVKTIVNLYAGE